jgi:cation transporter-like permease
MEAGEAIALCFILMLGMGLLALNYGLTTLHLARFHDREWAQFHRGLARLPPFLLLIGFPAVVVMELLESVPFISVLFVFSWGLLMFSFVTTLVTSVRMLVAVRKGNGGTEWDRDSGTQARTVPGMPRGMEVI